MGMFSIYGTKKDRKRAILAENRQRGRLHEDIYGLGERASGKEVVRTGKGHDYKVRERDPWTGKVKRTYYAEVKSSREASVSKLQKKTKKKLKGRYKIVRPTLW